MTTSLPTVKLTSRREAVAHVITFGALLSLPAVICFFRTVVDDPDVWWHLKAGEWILEHRAWPTADSFSSFGLDSPWTAYSWLPELILYGLFKGLGLNGLLLYTAGLSAAIVTAFCALLRRLHPNLLLVAALTLTATLGLISLQMPRPWMFSILFFVFELDLLLTAGRTGNRRLLLWLVPLFTLWANVHIQFILGLAILGAAVTESLLVRIAPLSLLDDDSRKMPFAWMLLIFVLCVAATLLNPYHYHLYEVAYQLLGQSELWNLIQELRAMPFRSVANWTVLAVTVSAAFALGWRRRVRLLLVLLFAAAVYLGFRSQRDAWFVLLVGLASLAYVVPKPTTEQPRAPTWASWAITGVVALLVVVGSLLVSRSKLEGEVARTSPVEATKFIHDHQCPGPMFNTFTWGGYLIFNLPEVPVNIDGRTMVHGENRVLRHAATLRGSEGWQNDPELASAGLVVLPRQVTLTTLLKLDNRFRLIHEDSVAVVFDTNTDDLRREKPQ